MYLNKFGAMKMARTLAESSDQTVVFEGTASPRTDGKRIYVENPKDWWGDAQWTRWWGNFYHEIGHNVPAMRGCFDMIQEKKIDMRSFFGFGLNLIEDNRQERYKWDEYAGRRQALSRMHSLYLREWIADPKKNFGQSADESRQAVEALFIWDNWERDDWMTGLSGLDSQLYDMSTKQTREWVDALKASRFVLKDTTDAVSVYDMWKGILDEIFKFDSEKEEEKGKKPDGANSGSGDEKGNGQEGKGKEGKGDGKDTGKGDEQPRQSDSTVKYSDLIKHQHTDADEVSGERYGNLHIEYDVSPEEKWVSVEPHIHDYTKNPPSPVSDSMRDDILEACRGGQGLSQTVRRLLQIRSRDRWQYGKKSGRLHGASLHRLTIKDGGGASQRVFRQKKINPCLDVSFTVLGDGSGSMGRTKYTSMAASMMLLQEAVKPLGVPYELMSFTDLRRGRINIFKTFRGKVSGDRLLDSILDAGKVRNNNADGEAILFAYSRLIEQRTARRVLLVLSDGSPASRRPGADYHAKEVIKHIEREGKIEIYGVGIEDDNVKRLYKDWQVIKSSTELEKCLLDLIKNRIIK